MRSIEQMTIERIYDNIWNNSHSQEEYRAKLQAVNEIYDSCTLATHVYEIMAKYKCKSPMAIDLIAAKMSKYIEYLVEKGWIKW